METSCLLKKNCHHPNLTSVRRNPGQSRNSKKTNQGWYPQQTREWSWLLWMGRTTPTRLTNYCQTLMCKDPSQRTSPADLRTNYPKNLGTLKTREDLVTVSTEKCIPPAWLPKILWSTQNIQKWASPSGPLSLVWSPSHMDCPRNWPISSISWLASPHITSKIPNASCKSLRRSSCSLERSWHLMSRHCSPQSPWTPPST